MDIMLGVMLMYRKALTMLNTKIAALCWVLFLVSFGRSHQLRCGSHYNDSLIDSTIFVMLKDLRNVKFG